MKWRRNIGFLVALSVLGVLAAAALFFLISYSAEYASLSGKLKTKMVRLQALNDRNPFPSQENVGLTREQSQAWSASLSNLLAQLSLNQSEPVTVEPAQVPPLMERFIKDMRTKAASAGVVMPDRFAFGFDRYLTKGELPNSNDIARLSVQFSDIAALCNVCFASRVGSIRGIQRQIFEKDAQGSEDDAAAAFGRRGGRGGEAQAEQNTSSGLNDDGRQFSSERFTLDVTATEGGLWNLLSALAAAHPVMVVQGVQVSSDLPNFGKFNELFQPKAGDPNQPKKPVSKDGVMAGLSHQERVVAGRELINASLIVDVYRFKQPNASNAN